MKSKNHRGFTLIELLVVVAIIAILASVVMASLNSARAKSRDARRRVDLRQLQIALDLYYNANGNYPNTGASSYGTCPLGGSHTTSGASGWIPDLAPTYISVLPVDPKPVSTFGCYLYRGTGNDYKVRAYATVESTVSTTDAMYDPTNPNSYAIFTPAASAW